MGEPERERALRRLRCAAEESKEAESWPLWAAASCDCGCDCDSDSAAKPAWSMLDEKDPGDCGGVGEGPMLSMAAGGRLSPAAELTAASAAAAAADGGGMDAEAAEEEAAGCDNQGSAAEAMRLGWKGEGGRKGREGGTGGERGQEGRKTACLLTAEGK